MRLERVSTSTGDVGLGIPYTSRLAEAVAPLARPGEGWAAGIYEATGQVNTVLAANTNGVVLEAMHYLAFGPMLHPARPPGGER